LVQFRNSTGKTIATLRDPRNPNDANVTLSRNDDLKRYLNELQHLGLSRTKIPNLKVGLVGNYGPDSPPFNRRTSSLVQHQTIPKNSKRDDIDSYVTKLEKIAKDEKKKVAAKHEKKLDFTKNDYQSFYGHLGIGGGSFKSGIWPFVIYIRGV